MVEIMSHTEAHENIHILPAGEEFQVWLKIGVQSFPVGMTMNREEAEWYANQLNVALEKLIHERRADRC